MQISASKETIDYIIEKMFAEMHKQLLTEEDRRSMAAKRGWVTRRSNLIKLA